MTSVMFALSCPGSCNGHFSTVFSALAFPVPNIIGIVSHPEIGWRAIRDGMRSLCFSTVLLTLMRFLSSLKSWIYTSAFHQSQDRYILHNNTNTSVSDEITLIDFLPSLTAESTCCGKI